MCKSLSVWLHNRVILSHTLGLLLSFCYVHSPKQFFLRLVMHVLLSTEGKEFHYQTRGNIKPSNYGYAAHILLCAQILSNNTTNAAIPR